MPNGDNGNDVELNKYKNLQRKVTRIKELIDSIPVCCENHYHLDEYIKKSELVFARIAELIHTETIVKIREENEELKERNKELEKRHEELRSTIGH